MCRPIRLPESVIMPNGPARCSTSRVRACTIRRSWSSARCSACRRTPTANVARYATVVFRCSRHGGRPSSEAGRKGGVPLLQLSARSLRRLDAAGGDRPRDPAQSVRVSVDRDAPGGRFRRTAADGSVAGVVRRGGGCPRFGHAPDAPACAVAPCDPCLFLSGRPANLAGRIVVLSESSFVGNIPLPCLSTDRALSGARGMSLPEAGEGAPALCRHVR